MKKIIVILIVMTMLLTLSITSNSAIAANTVNAVNIANTAIKLSINGQIADLKGYAPYKSISGIMVPLAEASRAVCAFVEYVSDTKEVKVKRNDMTLVFQAGRKFVLVNGKSLAMGENAVNIKGKVYVPARFLYEKLGGTVGWDNKANCVVVNMKMTAGNTKTSETKPSDSSNDLIPVSEDFKPYIAELSQIDPDILKELQAYKDDKDGDLMYKKNGIGINFYMSNAEVIAKVGIGEVMERCKTIKSFMERENNVDYRTIDTKFIEQYRYFIMPDSGSQWTVRGKTYDEEGYAKLRYDDVKKYKIIEKAEFFIDTSLNYSNKNGISLTRGRLKFMFESVDPQYFMDYGLPQYELNKWYNADMEVQIGILFTGIIDIWPHSYYTYVNRFYLTDTVLRK